MDDGCPISDGWRFKLAAFYNPDLVRRFGSDLFGDGIFGGEGSATPRWVDWTAHTFDLTFTRGLTTPNVNSSTDTLNFSLLDDGYTPIKMWTPPGSLASPTINTPIRLTLIDPNGERHTLLTARLDRMRELHGPGPRTVECFAYGTKSALRTLVMPQQFGVQTVAERLDDVFAQIGYGDGHEPYPAAFNSVLLIQDPEIRTDERQLDAYAICQQATLTAGYFVGTTVDGTLAFTNLLAPDDEPVRDHITDCAGTGRGVVSTRQLWQSDTSQVLNNVQVLSEYPELSADATEQTSVARYGRRNKGFGFPITVAAVDKTTTQQLADAILEQTAFRVTRVSEIEFHTGVDANWYRTIAGMELDHRFVVNRSQPKTETAIVAAIGYTVALGAGHIEGVVHCSQSDGEPLPLVELTEADGTPITTRYGVHLVT